MFWSKKPSSAGESTSAEVGTPDQFDSALDTIAQLLRHYGGLAFDIDEMPASQTQQRCEELASRLLVGSPRGGDVDRGRRETRRDWAAIRHFFREHRVAEGGYVQRSLGNLRDAVRAFATSISTAIGEDRRSDERIAAQLERLDVSVRDNDTAGIRRDASALAELVKQAMERRRQREQQQLEALGQRVQELRSELDEARARATRDGLTELFNRAAFDEEVERVVALGLLLGGQPCLLMVDVDHFKSINDDFGHPVGDRVLRCVADTLVRNFLRREDFVARYGGEEFAVVVPATTLPVARSRAERVRQSVEALDLRETGVNRPVTVSIGIAMAEVGRPAADWVQRADSALYDAKRAGRNRVVLASSSQPSHGLSA